MSTPLFDDLPAALKSVQTRPLFVMRLEVKRENRATGGKLWSEAQSG